MVGMVLNSKVGDLEEDIREGCPRRLNKDMSVVMQEVVGKRSYFLSFQDWGEEDIFQTSSPLWSSGVK